MHSLKVIFHTSNLFSINIVCFIQYSDALVIVEKMSLSLVLKSLPGSQLLIAVIRYFTIYIL